MITMMLMSGIRLSGQQIQKQLATSVDLIVYVELYMDGIRRIAISLICGVIKKRAILPWLIFLPSIRRR